jgi:hypothetical protein
MGKKSEIAMEEGVRNSKVVLVLIDDDRDDKNYLV